MTPVSPVMPGSETIEIVLGRGQAQYIELPAVYLNTRSRPMITRWRLSEQERLDVMAGADIVLSQLTWQQLFQPVSLQVCRRDAQPWLPEEPEVEPAR